MFFEDRDLRVLKFLKQEVPFCVYPDLQVCEPETYPTGLLLQIPSIKLKLGIQDKHT